MVKSAAAVAAAGSPLAGQRRPSSQCVCPSSVRRPSVRRPCCPWNQWSPEDPTHPLTGMPVPGPTRKIDCTAAPVPGLLLRIQGSPHPLSLAPLKIMSQAPVEGCPRPGLYTRFSRVHLVNSPKQLRSCADRARNQPIPRPLCPPPEHPLSSPFLNTPLAPRRSTPRFPGTGQHVPAVAAQAPLARGGLCLGLALSSEQMLEVEQLHSLAVTPR